MDETRDDHVPPLAREVLLTVVAQLRDAEQRVAELERQLLGWHRSNEVSQRLATIPVVRRCHRARRRRACSAGSSPT
jgi:transposase